MPDYRFTGGVKPRQLVVRDHPAIAKTAEWMIPIIREQQIIANEVVPSYFWQYNLVRQRKCSCFISKSDPDSNCTACFGVGYLPGYSPVGYYNFVTLDATDPGLYMVNVEPNFDSGNYPTPLVLSDTALTGFVESSFMPCGPNLGTFTTLYFDGSSFGLLLQYSLDGDVWKDLAEAYDEQLKNTSRVKFRVFMSRAALTDPAPYFQVLQARLQVQKDPLIRLDVPRWVANLNSTDAGLIPLLETFNAYADARSRLEQSSLFVHVQSKRKFKTLTLNPNLVSGQLLSWDATMRLIQLDEPLHNIT